jgi:hypothetical protein
MEIEAQVAALGGESSQMAEALRHFSVPSMSAKTIVYKGLLRPDQLRNLYPDLSAPDYISRLAVYHARFSTNTMSTWAGAQPGRHVAHNGEINTIGNNERQWLNRMAAMEVENFSFGSGLSDSLRFDRALEQLLREGKSLTQAMYTLVPPAWRSREDMPQSLKDFFAWQSLGFEPWDGPAAMVITDGDAAEMHLDRSGLRPARYTILKDGTVIAGSEEGVLPVHASQIYHRGSLRSGQSLRVDPTQPDEAARIIDGETAGAVYRLCRTACQPYRTVAGGRFYSNFPRSSRCILTPSPSGGLWLVSGSAGALHRSHGGNGQGKGLCHGRRYAPLPAFPPCR